MRARGNLAVGREKMLQNIVDGEVVVAGERILDGGNIDIFDGVEELFAKGGLNVVVFSPFANVFGMLAVGFCDLGGGGTGRMVRLKRWGSRWVERLANSVVVVVGRQDESKVAVSASTATGRDGRSVRLELVAKFVERVVSRTAMDLGERVGWEGFQRWNPPSEQMSTFLLLFFVNSAAKMTKAWSTSLSTDAGVVKAKRLVSVY
jgi:hypothetical protein